MPNHTDNQVVLQHEDKTKIDMIERIMQDGGELCHTLIPEPRTENNEPAEGWYDWRVTNWGTKWEIYDASHYRTSDNSIQLTFLSAWSPPDRVFYKLAEMGFDVDARYLDEGWMYVGWFLHEDEMVLDYCESDIELAAKEKPELDDTFDLTLQMQEWQEEEEVA